MNNNTLRIIGGEFRGRKLSFASVPDLRPTSDRVRETVFNWLMHDTDQAKCCDTFAGSGALGWEMLSRGADLVVYCDVDDRVCRGLKETAAMLNCDDRVSIHQQQAQQYFQQEAILQYDVIFLDPPFRFALDMLPELLKVIFDNRWLAEQGKIYVEAPGFLSDDVLATIGLRWLKQKRAGEVCFGLVGRV